MKKQKQKVTTNSAENYNEEADFFLHMKRIF